ncbi:hypothetical protein CEXT_318321 [Caerostris extrusa]|uniref:Uncharacterized protein n=1 Tax=Caerostris extrusa TaxID=172846 RepID=A0AAV4MYN5_CAEEX|nr:hypothetical protein CEXT_318321 [Caerostris extrusa]
MRSDGRRVRFNQHGSASTASTQDSQGESPLVLLPPHRSNCCWWGEGRAGRRRSRKGGLRACHGAANSRSSPAINRELHNMNQRTQMNGKQCRSETASGEIKFPALTREGELD